MAGPPNPCLADSSFSPTATTRLVSNNAALEARTSRRGCASGHIVDWNDEVSARSPGDPLLTRSADRTPAEVDVDSLFREHRVRLTRLAAAITLDRAVAEEVYRMRSWDFSGTVGR